jgi:Arm DNA-binding domain
MTQENSESAVKATQGREAAGGQRHDSGGLYLEVTATGSKLWRMAYRFEGKQRTLYSGSSIRGLGLGAADTRAFDDIRARAFARQRMSERMKALH